MLLDKKILELDYAVSYGSVTLKSLQNENIPEVDLLVREAIQNSSDASLGEPGDAFAVQFNTGHFAPENFNINLTGIEDILNNMFPTNDAEFLEIRDTKTVGLTGCIRKAEVNSDDHGNFFKLIYDTGKKQTQKNAGGNWGFGKSVYYRVGKGIVIFYSRIKRPDSTYESRLIITLVEDESSPTAILGKVSTRSAGKAWWGIKDGEDLLPLTDEDSIQHILDIFNIKPFKASETGTSIIIPYVNTHELVKNIIPAEANISEDVRSRCTWAYDFEEYLTLAIQKWYAPKIQNLHLQDFCTKKRLNVYVNNKAIRYDSMHPFFKLVQELYTIALAKTYDYEYKSEWLEDVKCLPVSVRNYFDRDKTNSIAGYVSAIKITTEQMYGAQNYLDPCIYIRHFETDPDINEPIVMYARDPGMVIDYTIAGPWVKNISPPENSDEYIFAFFVPITSKKFKSDLSEKKYADMELGEYLRECESSDHMGWDDPANMQVVQRLQRNTAQLILSNVSSSQAVSIDASASKLSGKLGKKLLPPLGYGRKKVDGGGGASGSGGMKINNIAFKITKTAIYESELHIDFELKMLQAKKNAELSVLVNSEAGLIDLESWKSNIGTKFPIEFSDIEIISVESNVEQKSTFFDMKCNSACKKVKNDLISVEFEENDDQICTVRIQSNISVPIIIGCMRIKTSDKKYRPEFKIV